MKEPEQEEVVRSNSLTLAKKMKIAPFLYHFGSTSIVLFLGLFLSAPNSLASPLTAILKQALKTSADPTVIRQTIKSTAKVTTRNSLIKQNCWDKARRTNSSTHAQRIYRECISDYN